MALKSKSEIHNDLIRSAKSLAEFRKKSAQMREISALGEPQPVRRTESGVPSTPFSLSNNNRLNPAGR